MNIKMCGRRLSVWAASLLLAVSAQAQTPARIAHVAAQALMDQLPESRKAAADLQAYMKTWEDQYAAINRKIDAAAKEYNEQGGRLDEAGRAAKEAEALALGRQQAELQQKAQDAVAKKRAELYNPVMQKVQQTIAELAASKGYDYVIDEGTGTVMWAKPGPDHSLTTEARAKLGLK